MRRLLQLTGATALALVFGLVLGMSPPAVACDTCTTTPTVVEVAASEGANFFVADITVAEQHPIVVVASARDVWEKYPVVITRTKDVSGPWFYGTCTDGITLVDTGYGGFTKALLIDYYDLKAPARGTPGVATATYSNNTTAINLLTRPYLGRETPVTSEGGEGIIAYRSVGYTNGGLIAAYGPVLRSWPNGGGTDTPLINPTPTLLGGHDRAITPYVTPLQL